MNSTNWKETIFVDQKGPDNVTYVTVPKNIANFNESLVMISLLKIFEINQWIPVLSEKELATAVLETKEGNFFAGYVNQSTKNETGKAKDGSSKYSKGELAFQTFSVEKAKGKSRHLKTGGQDKLIARLSEMKGFTKEYWGLRSTINALFKSLQPIKVTYLETFMKSRPEILKNIKTNLKFKNGGVYRSEELAYLSERYSETQSKLDEFLARLDNPDREVAENFDQLYAPVKSMVERTDNEVAGNFATRAKILFPNDKKKKTEIWKRKALTEKLVDLSESQLLLFVPESLPGIQLLPSQSVVGSAKFMREAYAGLSKDNAGFEVITSWYANFYSSSEDDE